MQAVVVRHTGDAQSLLVEGLPRPQPGPNEALLRVAACGICTLDVLTRNGSYRRNVELPLIPGHEICGQVVALGARVRGLQLGQRVASTQRYYICGECRLCRSGHETLCTERRFLGQQGLRGGYAPYVAIAADNLAAVPEGLSSEHAAIAACAIGTSLNAVRDTAAVRLGERVLITGAGGGLGVHAVQLACAAGALVIAQTSSPDKAALLAELGAHQVVVTARGEDFSPRLLAATQGQGVDVVIDNVGTVLFEPTRRSLGLNGRWVLVGQLNGDFVPFNPAQLLLKNQRMLSVHSTSRAQLQDTLDLLARGVIKAVVSGTCTVDGLADAHRQMERGGVAGRLVLRFADAAHGADDDAAASAP